MQRVKGRAVSEDKSFAVDEVTKEVAVGNENQGFLALTPRAQITAVDLSTAILIVHGWLYVVYLGCDFLLWRFVRFSFGRFLFFALGGIVPFLSFYFEFRIPAFVEARLAEVEARTAVGAAA